MLRSFLILAMLAVTPAAAQTKAANALFGAAPLPAELAPEPIGFYSRGCMAGAALMPPGLPDVLTKDEVLDPLAYLESGGNEQAPAFTR